MVKKLLILTVVVITKNVLYDKVNDRVNCWWRMLWAADGGDVWGGGRGDLTHTSFRSAPADN